jgi:putative ABC transport system permease protein
LRASALHSDRFNLWLIGSFASLALLLAALGIYGVMAYTTSQRTREIGIRVALGAQRGDVMKLVIAQGMKLALIGTVLGLAASLALTRLIKSLLFGVSPADPLAFTAAVLTLAIVALLACYIPARRAAKVDPMLSLRCE